jgi:hypothetical protein
MQTSQGRNLSSRGGGSVCPGSVFTADGVAAYAAVFVSK